ncbi:sensor domain-containing diguanylate cyclase, partial [Altererythrobacter sp. KTW20L]|uniref:sensor domain-containing diguanylate cyclase n=1 Tax=Altererythrobacter sp. KTW20L TaxID=2942210 RepID=UPI0020BFADD9
LQQQSRRQWRNMAGALLMFSLVVHVTFSQDHLPLLFLPVCALVLVAIWLGRIGVKIAVLILAVVATGVTINGYGPLNLLAIDEFRKVTFFQVYLGVLFVTGLVVVTIVTARSDAMARLADREQMLRQLLVHGKDVIFTFDANGRCTFCGGPTRSMLGLEHGEIVGRNVVELAQRVAMPLAMLDAHNYFLRPEPFSHEFQLSGDRKSWVEGSMTPIMIDGCMTSSVVTLRDITSQRIMNDDLHRRAHTDELTQTLNRAGFERRVAEALDDSGPTTLALIDLDQFKRINDTYGHASGDEVLVVVAEIIAAHVRQDDAVGRIGGDEFAVLFRCDEEAALAACQRICSCVSDTRISATDRRQMHVTISCGVAGHLPTGDRRALFDAADRALYEVKRFGRNGVRQAA